MSCYCSILKLGSNSICLRFAQFEPEIVLKVCLISKCCFLWLSFSKDYFMLKCCFLSLNLILFVILFFAPNLRRNGNEEKILRLEICLVYAYFFKHVSLRLLISFMLIEKRVFKEFSIHLGGRHLESVQLAIQRIFSFLQPHFDSLNSFY